MAQRGGRLENHATAGGTKGGNRQPTLPGPGGRGNDSAVWGLKAIVELLELELDAQGMQLYFAGSDLSSASWKKLMAKLEHVDFSVHIISQLGDDLECAIAVRALRWILTRRYGAEIARDHIFVTTSKTQGVLRDIVVEEGYASFVAPRSVSGHNSVLSPGALFALAVLGVDLRPFFRGAMASMDTLDERSFENPAWLYSGARAVLGRKGKIADYLCLTEPEHKNLGIWWRRLFSIRSGEYGMLPATVSCPEEIEDMQPLLLGGIGSVMKTMLRFAPSGQKVMVEMAWNDADGLRFMEGYALEQVHQQAMETVIEMAAQADVPLITIDCEKKCLSSLGEMLYFFELSSCLYGDLTGWKPYGSRPETGFQAQLRQNLQK